MAPPIAVVRTDWLTDPVVDQVGAGTVALVLHLAARASMAQAAAGTVTIAPDLWRAYVDEPATVRLVEAGLVDVLPAEDGGLAGVRVGDWLRRRIDTEGAINNRIRSRERMRRMRLRRAGPMQLPLWLDAAPPPDSVDRPSESPAANRISKIASRLGLWKTCGKVAGVTSDVTEIAADHLYPRAGARASVRTTYVAAASVVQKQLKVQKQPKGTASDFEDIGAEAPVAFRLLLALVARTRRARWSWRYPTTATDRLELLEAVRTQMARAHLAPMAERDIRRAIRIDECNDVSYRAAAGLIGGAR